MQYRHTPQNAAAIGADQHLHWVRGARPAETHCHSSTQQLDLPALRSQSCPRSKLESKTAVLRKHSLSPCQRLCRAHSCLSVKCPHGLAGPRPPHSLGGPGGQSCVCWAQLSDAPGSRLSTMTPGRASCTPRPQLQSHCFEVTESYFSKSLPSLKSRSKDSPLLQHGLNGWNCWKSQPQQTGGRWLDRQRRCPLDKAVWRPFPHQPPPAPSLSGVPALLTGCTLTLFLPYRRVALEFWCSDST